LQRKYWSSPEAKIYASVVLADEKWFDSKQKNLIVWKNKDIVHLSLYKFKENPGNRKQYKKMQYLNPNSAII